MNNDLIVAYGRFPAPTSPWHHPFHC